MPAYRFAQFVFDRERGLFDAGTPIALEPQVHELLAYLLEHRDRVVTRDELNSEIWDGRIVSEAALSTRIRAVRRALGDNRSTQKFIKTHTKRGFQFVASVELFEANAAEGAFASTNPTRSLASYLGWRQVVVACLAVMVVAVGSWWMFESATSSQADAPRLSIAVLPFENLSNDPAQDYLVDAFTEDLITDLSRIRDAFVIARRTSFTYKNRAVSAAEAADELGVRYLLEGSVRLTGNRVRVNAQLIDGETNRQIWSDRFDREMTDIFFGPNELTGQIASVLKAEIRHAVYERQGTPESMMAWDYALKGNMLLVQPDQDFRKAKEYFDKALALDPEIASAWSGLAFVHFAASFSNISGVTVPNSKDLSLEAAQRAVALDPRNAEGQWMVGVGYTRNGQTDLAWASCETALELNPNNDCVWVCAGLTMMAMGKPEEAIQFRTFTKHKFMGYAYVQSGQDAKAVEEVNQALASAPNDAFAELVLASALQHLGRDDEARAALARFRALPEGAGATLSSVKGGYSWLGPGTARFLEGLRLAGMPEV